MIWRTIEVLQSWNRARVAQETRVRKAQRRSGIFEVLRWREQHRLYPGLSLQELSSIASRPLVSKVLC